MRLAYSLFGSQCFDLAFVLASAKTHRRKYLHRYSTHPPVCMDERVVGAQKKKKETILASIYSHLTALGRIMSTTDCTTPREIPLCGVWGWMSGAGYTPTVKQNM